MLGRCVVEYIKEYFEPNANCMFMHVKCSNGDWKIPLDRKLQFQPTNTERPLSPLGKVCKTYRSSEIVDSQIDRILGVRTMGNTTFFQKSES